MIIEHNIQTNKDEFSPLYNNNRSSSSNECIICLENNANSINLLPSNFIRECTCNFNIHDTCLNEWIQQKPCCPICNTILIKNNIDTQIYTNIDTQIYTNTNIDTQIYTDYFYHGDGERILLNCILLYGVLMIIIIIYIHYK